MATQNRWTEPFVRFKFQYDSPSLGRKEKTIYVNMDYFTNAEFQYNEDILLPLFELSGISTATAQSRIVDTSARMEVISYVKEFDIKG